MPRSSLQRVNNMKDLVSGCWRNDGRPSPPPSPRGRGGNLAPSPSGRGWPEAGLNGRHDVTLSLRQLRAWSLRREASGPFFACHLGYTVRPESSVEAGPGPAHCLKITLDAHPEMLYRVNKSRPRHPKKEIEGVLREAESAGWKVVPTQPGHRWGVMQCGARGRPECRMSIWSTPRNAGNHARRLRRFIARCPHRGD